MKNIKNQPQSAKQQFKAKQSSYKNKLQSTSLSLYQKLFLVGALLLTFIIYMPALKNDLTNWDDKSYVAENKFITEINKENLNAMFFAPETRYWMGNYHPLSMLSLAVDYHFAKKDGIKNFGTKLRAEKLDEPRNVDPFVFHLSNIIFHVINTLLVFFFLFLLLQNFEVAIIAAILFGVNALHVESVAWVSERKDVLYTMFFLLSLISYLKYTKSSKYIYLGLSVLCFFLSIISKAQAVSLAVTLVAIDWYQNRKLWSPKVILEKVPFFALSLIFGLIAVQAQKQGEAIHELAEYPFYYRIFFGLYGYIMYMVKLLFPSGMAAIYPYPHPIQESIFPLKFWFFPIPALAVAGAFFYCMKKAKSVAFGIAFFTINIFLLLQFLPVGSAIMADRYSYIPSIGFFLVVAYFVKWIFDNKVSWKPISIGLLSVYIAILSFQSFQQCMIWKDSVTLWTNTVNTCPYAVVAWNNLGSAFDKLNQKEKAIEAFNKAVEYKPDYYHAFYNRGTALKDLNRHKEAVKDFDRAIEINVNFGEAYHNRGISKEGLNDFAGAMSDYNHGIELMPRYPNIYSSRGVAKGKMGNLKDAILDFNKAIELSPQNPEAYSNRGLANDKLNNFEQAIADYTTSINMNPKFATAYSNRGITRRRTKDFQGALNDLNAAISLNPNFAEAYLNRAMTHFEIGNQQQGCADLQTTLRLGINVSEDINRLCK